MLDFVLRAPGHLDHLVPGKIKLEDGNKYGNQEIFACPAPVARATVDMIKNHVRKRLSYQLYTHYPPCQKERRMPAFHVSRRFISRGAFVW